MISSTRSRTAALALVLGIATLTGCSGSTGDSGTGGRPTGTKNAETEAESAALVSPATAAAATQLVASFVTAVSKGDHAAAFALLDATGQARFGSVDAWAAAQGRSLPIRSVDHLVARPQGDSLLVTGDAALEPVLDLTLGLVPARAEGTWVLRRAAQPDSGSAPWGIDPDAITYVPAPLALPGEDPAVDGRIVEGARRWIEGRRDCSPDAGTEPAHGLIGHTGVADSWCSSSAQATFGAVATTDVIADPRAIVAAYGEDALRWGRVIDVSGPNPMRLVLAPVGDLWQVAAVAPA